MRFKLIVLISMPLFGCGVRDFPTVESRGSLHAMMMQNDVDAKVRLDTLQQREHMYGLGAVENLEGEIFVWTVTSACRGFETTRSRPFEATV
jgi:hypothetical protein